MLHLTPIEHRLLIVLAGTLAHLPYAIELGYLTTLTAWTIWGYRLLAPHVRSIAPVIPSSDRG